MAPESGDQADLRWAAADLEEVRSALGAIGIVLAATAFALSDAMRREAKRQRAERAERRASKPSKPPAPEAPLRGL